MITPKSYLKWMLICIGGLVLMDLLRLVSVVYLQRDYVFGLIQLFHMGEEANVPTWFSSVNLLGLSYFMYKALPLFGDRVRAARCLMIGTVFLSLDETAQLHEKMSPLLERLVQFNGLLRYPWVLAGLVAFLGFCWLTVKVCSQIPRALRPILYIGGLVFFVSCLGLEAIEGIVAHYHTEDYLPYQLIQTVEEAGEMVGITLMAYGFLRFAQTAPQGTIHET